MYTNILDQLALQNLTVNLEELQVLSPQERLRLLKDLNEITTSYVPEKKDDFLQIRPLTEVITKKDAKRNSIESSLVQRGEVAFVFLAGGQSTRFKNVGWKGTYPIFQGKSVIKLLLEKLEQDEYKVPIAFLVSNETKGIIQEHLEETAYSYEMVLQNSWPVFTESKALYLENGFLAYAPAGNGLTLQHLKEQGLIDKWKSQGVKYIACVVIDNPLIDLTDADFWQVVEEQSPQIALKAIERAPFETFGALCLNGDRIELLEAAWFAGAGRESFNESETHFPWGSSGFLVFSMDFLMNNAEKKLPAHRIEKSDPSLGKHYRFEQFLTDYLAYSTSTVCYGINREEEFSPLKKPEDLERIQKKLQQHKLRSYSDE